MPESSAGMVLGFCMCMCTLGFELHEEFYWKLNQTVYSADTNRALDTPVF